MKLHIHLSTVLFLLTFVTPALTQPAGSKVTIHRIICDGDFMNNPARISGMRQLSQSWGRGGNVNYIDFKGQLESLGNVYPLEYYKRAHYNGVLYTEPPMRITVLDNTGGKMKIYEKSYQAPRQLGEFVCQWIPVQYN